MTDGTSASSDNNENNNEKDLEGRFTEMVSAHQLMVFRYVRFLMRDPRAAEEITQDTFVTAYLKMRQAGPEGDPGAWLRGIARNLTLRARSKGKVQVLFLDDEMLSEAEANWLRNQSAEGGARLDDPRLKALRTCVEGLSPEERGLLKLRYEDSSPRQVIADRLAISAEGVKTRLRRLRAKLSDCVQRKLVG